MLADLVTAHETLCSGPMDIYTLFVTGTPLRCWFGFSFVLYFSVMVVFFSCLHAAETLSWMSQFFVCASLIFGFFFLVSLKKKSASLGDPNYKNQRQINNALRISMVSTVFFIVLNYNLINSFFFCFLCVNKKQVHGSDVCYIRYLLAIALGAPALDWCVEHSTCNWTRRCGLEKSIVKS